MTPRSQTPVQQHDMDQIEAEYPGFRKVFLQTLMNKGLLTYDESEV